MKLTDILLEYLTEQVFPNPDDDDVDDFGNEPDEHEPQDTEELPPPQPEPEMPEVPAEPEAQQQPERQAPGLSRAIKKVIEKWHNENPGLTEANALIAVNFFNSRKNHLRPPNIPNQRDLPEIYAFSIAYPNFFSGNLSEDMRKMKDIQSYTWDQMEFLMDRFTQVINHVDATFSIEGDTPELQLKSSIKRWESDYNKILDEIYNDNGNEGRVIVHKIDCKEDAQVFGRLQNLLVSKYGGINWCVTRQINNLWTNYRPDRGFYFIWDKTKPEDSIYHVTAIQTYKNGSHAITNRANDPHTQNITWEEIEKIWPVLKGKENLFPWFGTTKKEKISTNLDNVSFFPGSEHDFATASSQIQYEYVETNRIINSPRAFKSMSYQLQELYVNKSEFETYKQRFKNNEPNTNNKFGMLNALRPIDYRRLDKKIKGFGIKAGINAIKIFILSESYTPIRIDNQTKTITDAKGNEIEETTTIVLYKEKRPRGRIGAVNLNTLDWLNDLSDGYVEGKTSIIRVPDQGFFMIQKFQSEEDITKYFYFAYPEKTLRLPPSDPNRARGQYLSKEKGDELLQKYKPISMGRK